MGANPENWDNIADSPPPETASRPCRVVGEEGLP